MGYKCKFTTPVENAMEHFSGWSGVKCQTCNRVTTKAQLLYSMRVYGKLYIELAKALKAIVRLCKDRLKRYKLTWSIYSMSINLPFRRTCRQFVDGKYTEGGRWQYMVHPKFAQSPEHYVRAFLLLLKDLQELFDYIEPADENLPCYSFRIHALLLRASVEVEANCKAIMKENGYLKTNKWGKDIMNIEDYRKINVTHRLSSYQVKDPYWNGTKNVRSPFSAWSSGGTLPWYEAYNTAKHDRHSGFKEATFDHLLDACCGVLVILSAQFETNDFSPGNSLLALHGPNDGMESGIGGYFRVKFPNDWPLEMRYDFDWQKLKNEPDPFRTIDYSKIP